MIKLINSTFYKERETRLALSKFVKNTEWLSFGPECLKFERNFATYQKRKHCIFFNSGSMANLALIQALLNLDILKRGDGVGFSSLTWSTNVMPLIQLGLKPIPVDVEIETLNVSSKKLANALDSSHFKTFFLTNLLGFCDDIDQIRSACRKRNITLIEDNCESLGSVYKGKKLGNFGLASTFSFFVGHHLSTIEGGAVCTDDNRLASMLRMVRAHGWDRHLNPNDQKNLKKTHDINDFYARYTFYDLSYNLRPTEINAFVGNAQIKHLDEMFLKRNSNFLKVAKELYKNTDKYIPIKFDHLDFVSNFAIPFVCRSVKIRDEMIKKCAGKIEVRPIVGGDITDQPFFRKYASKQTTALKNTNSKLINDCGFYVGNNPDYTKKDIDTIISILS